MAKNVTIIPASGSLTFDNASTFGKIFLDGSNNLVISGSTIAFSSPNAIDMGGGGGDVYIGDGVNPTDLIFEQNGSIRGSGPGIKITLGDATTAVGISTDGTFTVDGIAVQSSPTNYLSYNSSTKEVTYTALTSGTSGGVGSSGTAGPSGTSGTNGSAGTSGASRTSGRGGTNGTSGTNGGSHGTSGVNRTSGRSGSNGTSGTSASTSGISGASRTSGTNGINDTSGTSAAP